MYVFIDFSSMSILNRALGQTRLQIKRSWRGAGPSLVLSYDSSYKGAVHRIKVDEKNGLIIYTSHFGGLTVLGLDEDRSLWRLPLVSV